MADRPETNLGARVRQAREALGLSQDALARDVKTTQTTIDKIERGLTLRSRFLPAIFSRLGLPLGDLANHVAAPTGAAVVAFAAGDLVGARDLPVFAAARGGKGHLLVNFEPIEYVKRPFMLEGVPKGYAILVVGDSMAPLFRHGDIVLVHPHLAPLPDHEAVIYDAPPGGEVEAIVKTYLKDAGGKWHLRQYNPPEDFTVPKIDWPYCHRIVGKYDRR